MKLSDIFVTEYDKDGIQVNRKAESSELPSIRAIFGCDVKDDSDSGFFSGLFDSCGSFFDSIGSWFK